MLLAILAVAACAGTAERASAHQYRHGGADELLLGYGARLTAMTPAFAPLNTDAVVTLPPRGRDASEPGADDLGSLVRTTVRSEVGVVLDEIPSRMRDRVAAALSAKPATFWTDRARSQLRLTAFRLVFRGAFYPDTPRQGLPLPPEDVWTIDLVGPVRRHSVNGHDVLGVGYELSSVLVSDAASPGVSEPKLDRIGGKWRERFKFPVDPELLFQRTGYACMDEDSFPFNSVDSEEVDTFYDDTAVVESTLGNVGQAHFTLQPTQSCAKALVDHVGKVETAILYERLPWSATLADDYRFGEVTGAEPDLAPYLRDFAASRSTYRYVHGENGAGCEVEEGSVTGTGWRRVLQFATSDENVGERDLTIGGVDYTLSGAPGENDLHNLFELSTCHGHYHFAYYGRLGWSSDGASVNAKNGFCLQSTQRTANRETSPLHNLFATCLYQGVAPGWSDQYKAGLPNQWVDTTTFPPGIGTRSFVSNPVGFLCEGTFVDAAGNPLAPGDPVVWADTGLFAENGEPVEAPLCALKDGWDDNNAHATTERILPHGQGLITSACTRGQIGPLRNCGFGTAPTVNDCTPGAPTTTTFTIPPGAKPQVVRVTEYSHQLGSPVPARYEDSWVPLRPGVSDQPAMLTNAIVRAGKPLSVKFTCPAPRMGGAYEPGGTYSVYTAPVFPEDPAAAVSQS